MSEIAQLQRMNIGSGFRAYSLRGGEMAAPIDPFLGVDHAWMSAATFQPHPMRGFQRCLTCFSTRKPESITAIRWVIVTAFSLAACTGRRPVVASCMTSLPLFQARPSICCKSSSIWPLIGRAPTLLR